MSYAYGPADWIDLAIGRLEDAKRSLRECDRLRQGCDICDELRQARRCLNKALMRAPGAGPSPRWGTCESVP